MIKKEKKDFENIGKMLINIYETGYLNANESYKHAFIKGVVSGVGGVIGASIVIALLVWILSFFNSIPLIGPFTKDIRSTIENSTNR